MANGTLDTVDELTLTRQVASGEDIEARDFISLNSDGEAEVTDNTNVDQVLGIANTDADASGSTPEDLYVGVVTAGLQEVEGYVDKSGAGYNADIEPGDLVAIDPTDGQRVVNALDGTTTIAAARIIGKAVSGFTGGAGVASSEQILIRLRV